MLIPIIHCEVSPSWLRCQPNRLIQNHFLTFVV